MWLRFYWYSTKCTELEGIHWIYRLTWRTSATIPFLLHGHLFPSSFMTTVKVCRFPHVGRSVNFFLRSFFMRGGCVYVCLIGYDWFREKYRLFCIYFFTGYFTQLSLTLIFFQQYTHVPRSLITYFHYLGMLVLYLGRWVMVVKRIWNWFYRQGKVDPGGTYQWNSRIYGAAREHQDKSVVGVREWRKGRIQQKEILTKVLKWRLKIFKASLQL